MRLRIRLWSGESTLRLRLAQDVYTKATAKTDPTLRCLGG
jgi:hypothetical protein